MRTRVKICGITRPGDGQVAAAAGADAIGLVFHEPSPRHLTPASASAICAALPPFVSAVGLFVDAPAAWIESVLGSVRLDLLQFHGAEDAAACRRYGIPYIKALRMRDDVDVAALAARYPDARALLLDSYDANKAGGTGVTFDWRRVPRDLPQALILAGGLTAANVQAAVTQVRPYAVDVSGGVESAPGIKDAAKIAAFIQQVRGTHS